MSDEKGEKPQQENGEHIVSFTKTPQWDKKSPNARYDREKVKVL
jgi:hypothetical protein